MLCYGIPFTLLCLNDSKLNIVFPTVSVKTTIAVWKCHYYNRTAQYIMLQITRPHIIASHHCYKLNTKLAQHYGKKIHNKIFNAIFFSQVYSL